MVVRHFHQRTQHTNKIISAITAEIRDWRLIHCLYKSAPRKAERNRTDSVTHPCQKVKLTIQRRCQKSILHRTKANVICCRLSFDYRRLLHAPHRGAAPYYLPTKALCQFEQTSAKKSKMQNCRGCSENPGLFVVVEECQDDGASRMKYVCRF